MLAVTILLLTHMDESKADAFTDDGGLWRYTLEEGGAVIAGHVTKPTGELSIPGELDGYPVRRIGDEAFARCSGLTGVTIPDSVTRIGDWAFSGCSGLTGVTIPIGVTDMGLTHSPDALLSILTYHREIRFIPK